MNYMSKEDLLTSLISKSSTTRKYKRLSLSPIRYAGGKSLAVGYITELLPDNITKIVSPFFGGGSIEIALNQKMGISVVGYDIFDILTNYWNYQIKHSQKLYNELKKLKANRTTFNKIRRLLVDHWDKTTKSQPTKTKLKNEWSNKKIITDPLTLAVYYYYNFNLSYGPGFLGWTSDIYMNDTKYAKTINKVKNFQVKNFKISCADFTKAIPKHKNDFLYCDPPYHIGSGSKTFAGIYPMRNIPIHHKGFNHELLKDLLLDHKGGFILSYNDCPLIRKWYKNYQQSFPSWQYTMGQGEVRIGKNRNKSQNNIKKSHEILIYCPPK